MGVWKTMTFPDYLVRREATGIAEAMGIMEASVKFLEEERSRGVGIPFEKHGRLVRYRLGTIQEHFEKLRRTIAWPGPGKPGFFIAMSDRRRTEQEVIF